jgi:peroxiredoxin
MATDKLKIGSVMPDFNLPAVDGKNYSSKDYEDNKALIVIFSCNHCPYVQAYEERIKEIDKKYGSKNVKLVAINSNDSSKYEDDSFEGMIKRAGEKGFSFPYLRDEDQSAARSFGATHTPEAFIFDKERKLIYHGKIDDNWKEPDKVQNRYLENAIDEFLSGEEISIRETFSIGCTIKWKD